MRSLPAAADQQVAPGAAQQRVAARPADQPVASGPPDSRSRPRPPSSRSCPRAAEQAVAPAVPRSTSRPRIPAETSPRRRRAVSAQQRAAPSAAARRSRAAGRRADIPIVPRGAGRARRASLSGRAQPKVHEGARSVAPSDRFPNPPRRVRTRTSRRRCRPRRARPALPSATRRTATSRRTRRPTANDRSSCESIALDRDSHVGEALELCGEHCSLSSIHRTPPSRSRGEHEACRNSRAAVKGSRPELLANCG